MERKDKITEQDSHYDDLELMNTREILESINKEDRKIALAIAHAIPYIEALVDQIFLRMREGGRLFYIGAGTSGRLGVLDASECPPTFGVSPDLIIGLIAGGDTALRNAVEFAEDSATMAWNELLQFRIDKMDSVIGIAASGTTPYVINGIRKCRSEGILTGCITCNTRSPLAAEAEFPVEVIVGPEFITGSTRMKSGTAQKMVLNMISTSLMVKLGRVKGNKMVNMALSNEKLIDRGVKIITKTTGIESGEARSLLLRFGSVRAVLEQLAG